MSGSRLITRIGQAVFALFLTALTLLATSAPVFADHTVDHRYWIEGKVTDVSGQPVGGVKVEATPPAGQAVDAVTDGSGEYKIKLHVHNTELEGEVTVKAAGQTKTHTLKFDPNNLKDERVGKVDIKSTFAAAEIGKSAAARSFLGGLLPYVVVAVLVLGAGGIIFATYPRKKGEDKSKKGPGAAGIGPKRKKSKKRSR